MSKRILKFRLYSFTDKLWYYFDIYEGYPQGIYGAVTTPLQFTCNYDKDGKEIYEGDIIEYTEKLFEHGDIQKLKGQVIYDTDYATFAIAAPGDRSVVWNLFSDMVISNLKVIGNINENPELLKT